VDIDSIYTVSTVSAVSSKLYVADENAYHAPGSSTMTRRIAWTHSSACSRKRD